MTPAQLSALKVELIGVAPGTVQSPGAGADPKALGYHAPLVAGLHADVAVLVNGTYAAATTINVGVLTSDAIRACFTVADLAQVTTNDGSGKDRAWLDFALQSATVDTTRSTFSTELLAILNKTGMAGCKGRVVAVVQRKATRAEELFGLGATVDASLIALALLSP